MKYRENESEPWKELYIKALDSMPIGMMVDFVGTDIPNGWLICDGSTLDEETYPELYDALGGSGSTFTLPDCKGRVLVGYDANDTDFNAIGKTGGSKELQAHTHNYDIKTNSGSGDVGQYLLVANNTGSVFSGASGAIKNAGNGNSGNLQPYYVAYKIIKAKNTTPTMASIVNTKNNSTTDGYSCKFINEHYGGVVLYEDANGTNQTINLSDDVSNYNHFVIVYKNSDWNEYYTHIKYDTSSDITISGNHVFDVNRDLYTFKLTMSGTTISWVSSYFSSNNGTPFAYNPFKIVKVIGYK